MKPHLFLFTIIKARVVSVGPYGNRRYLLLLMQEHTDIDTMADPLKLRQLYKLRHAQAGSYSQVSTLLGIIEKNL